MKREIIAFVLLAALFAVATYNTNHITELTEDICDSLELSVQAAGNGNMILARYQLQDALNLWLSSEGYTHVMLRHSEIDAATDAFYELKQLMMTSDREGLYACCDKLIYHLRSLSDMERPSIRSIL